MTRDDLEQLDTKRLRALAKERFAGKARALRTRGALLAALSRSQLPAVPVAEPRTKAKQPRRATVGPGPTSTVPRASSRVAALASAPLPEPQGTDDALVEEGFFVGPPSKRNAPRRPPSPPAAGGPRPTPETPPPPSQDADAPHLLARDATTLFLFWDFRRHLERGAAFGLHAPFVRFRLYDVEALVRVVECPLGRHSLYLEGLEPGHLYRVEAWLAGSDGHERPTGRRSAAVRLAPAAPSAGLEVQLSRVPWEQPLAAWRAGAASVSPPAAEHLPPPSRVELPASLEWRGGVGPVGPSSGRP
jgi:Domain of unknown function (DUF4912)